MNVGFWTIRKKISLVLMISLLAVSVLSVINLRSAQKFSQRYAELSEVDIRQLMYVDDVKSDIFKLQNLLTTESTYAYFSKTTTQVHAVTLLNERVEANLKALLALAKRHNDKELEQIVANITIRYSSFYKMCLSLPEVYSSDEREYIAVFVKGLNDVSSKMYQELSLLHEFVKSKLEKEKSFLSAYIDENIEMTVVTTVLGILAMMIAALFISGLILRSVRGLDYAAKHLVEGDYDLSRRLPILGSDELGRVTHNFNQFLDKVEVMDREIKTYAKELEARVQDELMKNREKDQLMIRQSRNAALGEMMGNIAHQWRQPINALGLLIQDIKDAFDFNELTPEYLQKTSRRSMEIIDKMSTTIDDFRDFFRPNKKVDAFAIKEVVYNAVNIIGATLESNSIVLRENFESEGVVQGYANEFSQVVLNILSNAQYQLMKNNPTDNRFIDIAIEEKHGVVELIIGDNGGGIDSEVMEKIFDPYFTTKDQGEGTGIGLYMSKMIIEKNMDGKIWVRNSNLGAEFIISMQAATPAA